MRSRLPRSAVAAALAVAALSPAPTAPSVATAPGISGSAGGSAPHSSAGFGDHALVGYGLAVHVVNMAVPESPMVVASVRLPGPALQIAVRGDRAYVAAGPGGLVVLDVAVPSAPRVVAQAAYGAPVQGVATAEHNTVVTVDQSLLVLDVSAAMPAIIGRVQLTGWGHSVSLDSSRALVSVELPEPLPRFPFLAWPVVGQLDVVDLSAPASPRLVATADLREAGRGGAYASGYAFIGSSETVCDGCASRGLVFVVDVRSSDTASLVGEVRIPSRVTSLVATDKLVYVTTPGGLYVLDSGDPSQPEIVSSVSVVHGLGSLALGPGWMLVNGAHLQVLDTTDPRRPASLGWMNLQGHVAVDGPTGYVASDELTTVDLSDVAHPHALAEVAIDGYATDVEVAKGYAYVTSSGSLLTVVDVHDLLRPQPVAALALDLPPIGVAAGENLAFVLDRRELIVIDVADPRRPLILARQSVPTTAAAVAVAGPVVAVVAKYGLYIVNIDDPTAPYIDSSLPFAFGARDLDISGDVVLVAAGSEGLKIVDIANPSRPHVVSTFNYRRDSWAEDVAAAGNTAVLVSQQEIVAVDITNPTLPTILDTWGPTYSTIATARDNLVVLSDGRLLVLDPSALAPLRQPGGAEPPDRWSARRVDVWERTAVVTDYAATLRLFHVDSCGRPNQRAAAIPGGANAMAFHDDLLYVVASSHGTFMVYRVTREQSLQAVGGVPFDGGARAIAIADGYAYVIANGDDVFALFVFDVENSSAPHLVAQVDEVYGQAGGLVVNDGMVLVAANDVGLRLLDGHDPSKPSAQGQLGYGIHGTDVAVVGGVAFVATRDDGVLVVDVKNPEAPTIMGHLLEDTAVASLEGRDGRLYIGTSAGRLWIYDVTQPRSPYALEGVDIGSGSSIRDVAVRGRQAFMAAGEAGLVVVELDSKPCVPRRMQGFLPRLGNAVRAPRAMTTK